MELVRGTKLTEFCDPNRLSTEARLKLFIQVCQAVHHAHQKGIIHRDLKPSNVMVTLHGRRRRGRGAARPRLLLRCAVGWRWRRPEQPRRVSIRDQPASAASALRVETVAHAGGQATVSFTAAAQQTYTVELSPTVAGGSWEKLADVVAQAADRSETVTDAAAGEGARFYRVVTPRRP